MRLFSLSLAAIISCGLSASLYGGVILSENFDELTDAVNVTSAGAFSAINSTDVDIVGPALFAGLCASPEGGSCIDMDGSGTNPQGQLQSSMLFPAGSYLLSFDLIGSQRGNTASTTVTFGNYDQEFTLTSSDDTDGIVVDQLVTLSTTGYLLFVSDTAGYQGDLLDNVVVSTATSSTPEPATLPLMGFTLAGLAVELARRRRSPRCG